MINHTIAQYALSRAARARARFFFFSRRSDVAIFHKSIRDAPGGGVIMLPIMPRLPRLSKNKPLSRSARLSARELSQSRGRNAPHKKPRSRLLGSSTVGGSRARWAEVQNRRCIASLWTKGLCRVDSDSDETVMSGNVVGRLCRAAHYSTWQKAFQFGTHRVSKRSLIIIMPTVLLMLLLLRWPWLTSVLKGVGRALLAGLSHVSLSPSLPPAPSHTPLSLSLALAGSLALSNATSLSPRSLGENLL